MLWSPCIDLVSHNRAVHHHRVHDDTVRPTPRSALQLVERMEARLLAIGLDTIEISDWLMLTHQRWARTSSRTQTKRPAESGP
jgi:hypothetical protein